MLLKLFKGLFPVKWLSIHSGSESYHFCAIDIKSGVILFIYLSEKKARVSPSALDIGLNLKKIFLAQKAPSEQEQAPFLR